jgi:hypothetical protein
MGRCGYTIFISHSSKNFELAKAIKTNLNNAFEGNLNFFLSPEMSLGAKWKEQIQESFSSCDAGLFLVTPDFSESSWLIAEFTAFWMQDKPTYILSVGEINFGFNSFFSIVNDIQRGKLSDKNMVKSLILQLSRATDTTEVPYKVVDSIIELANSYQSVITNELSALSPIINIEYARDRIYKLLSSKWHYTLNPDKKTLRGQVEATRRIKCIYGPIPFVNLAVTPAENLTPFSEDDDYEIQLIEYEYADGDVSIREPHKKSGNAFAFHVDINPPLQSGSEIYFKIRYVFPRYHVATSEYLEECCKKAKLESRTYELGSFSISHPIEKFIYEISFSEECRIRPLPPEALVIEAAIPEENALLAVPENYFAKKSDGKYIMHLERSNPPMHVKYRLRWRPPHEKELLTK